MEPAAVTIDNAREAWHNIQKRFPKIKSRNKVFKYKVNDYVRISKYKSTFEKGYEAGYTEEIFQITKTELRQNIPTYELKDLAGEDINGFFYEQEIVRVSKDLEKEEFLIEKILKTKGKGKNKQNRNGFISTLNSFLPTVEHFSFKIDASGFTKVKRKCTPSFCKTTSHRFLLSDTMLDILGFDRYIDENKKKKFVLGDRDGKSYEFTNISKRPFSLIRGLISSLFVYSDICSPYVTGDVNTPLLRIVPLDMSSYSYAMTVTNTYGSPNYIPVVSNSFRTIEIDIRDNIGNPVLFEYGPLNVTLHFKRID
ncbi:GSCOCG00012582001-RA-CDS [Cotesia congregata]|nr:GSCOCG00012582001-RA-CDS [Cotesia congregata]